MILQALATGPMRAEGAKLSEAERVAVAAYLGTVPAQPARPLAGHCQEDAPLLGSSRRWEGWGANPSNTRFQPQSAAQLSRGQVPRLKLKWAFGFPGAFATFGQPTVYGGRVFVGSEDGTVYSLDARTGCTYWTFKALGTVKTAVSVDPARHAAYFGDTMGNIYALNAVTGAFLWKTRAAAHPQARITGSPLLVADRLYVPVSSGEEGAAIDPQYPCCTFRGSVVALSAGTGRKLWASHTIPSSPKPLGRRNASGTEFWGPSGAAVWSAPTADPRRHALYVSTGNNYSDPPTRYADAVIAFDMRTGKMLWSRQLTPRDLWNGACVAPDRANCPPKPGGDFDIGSPPILISLPEGRAELIVGQKSGMVYALDPDRRGHVLWQTRIARGGPLGGIQWGGAVIGGQVFFPRSDWADSKPNEGGGLFALKILGGEISWFSPPPPPNCTNQVGCSTAQMAPSTAVPGVVFSGSLDGHLRAYGAADGKVIWDFDTAHTFRTVDGVDARGGSLNASGATVAGGMVYVNSGYTNAMPGNVLLAFSVDGK